MVRNPKIGLENHSLNIVKFQVLLKHIINIRVDDGFLVFFAGENPPLNNALTDTFLNTPRNLGFVKVVK